jgi:hypothetical protein
MGKVTTLAKSKAYEYCMIAINHSSLQTLPVYSSHSTDCLHRQLVQRHFLWQLLVQYGSDDVHPGQARSASLSDSHDCRVPFTPCDFFHGRHLTPLEHGQPAMSVGERELKWRPEGATYAPLPKGHRSSKTIAFDTKLFRRGSLRALTGLRQGTTYSYRLEY